MDLLTNDLLIHFGRVWVPDWTLLIPMMKSCRRFDALIRSEVIDRIELVSEETDYLEAIPKALALCVDPVKQVRMLYLAETKHGPIDANIVNTFTHLKNLRNVSLAYGQVLDSAILQFTNFQNLSNLDVSSCTHLTDACGSAFAHLTNLQTLSLSSGHFTEMTLEYLQNCTKLEDLDLSSLEIGGKSLQYLTKMVNLRTLTLFYCTHITEQHLSILVNLSNLTELDLWKTAVATLVDMIPCTKLATLKLNRCNYLTDAGLEHISVLNNLTRLDIKDCRTVTADGWKPLSRLTNLRHLNMSENITARHSMSFLSPLTALEELELADDNNLNLDPLTTLQNLVYLNLNNCQRVSVSSPDFFDHLEQLNNFNFNNATGLENVLPSLFSHTNLHVLLLNGCDIRPEPTTFLRLTYLELSKNQHLEEDDLLNLAPFTPVLEDLYIRGCPKIGPSVLPKLSVFENLSRLGIGSPSWSSSSLVEDIYEGCSKFLKLRYLDTSCLGISEEDATKLRESLKLSRY